jgi:uncharacterized protein YfbU (UPF0304 family)
MVSLAITNCKIMTLQKKHGLRFENIYSLLKRPDDTFDDDFIDRVFITRNYWGLSWVYGDKVTLLRNTVTQLVIEVLNALRVCNILEHSWASLPEFERLELARVAEIHEDTVFFNGFDSSTEAEYQNIYQFLTEEMGMYDNFKERMPDQTSPQLPFYRRLSLVLETIGADISTKQLELGDLARVLMLNNEIK